MSTITTAPRTAYRYYEFVMAAFVAVLLCSNLVGPAKIVQVELPLLGAATFGAGVLFFPISYVFGDILTEVYGYARARRVIWAGFGALLFASVMSAVEPPAAARVVIWPLRFANRALSSLTSEIESRRSARTPVHEASTELAV